jgi:hypothetical protein
MSKDDKGKNEDSTLCCGPSAERTASVEGKPAECCSEKKAVGCCSKAANDAIPCCESPGGGATSFVAEAACCSATSLRKQDSVASDFNLAEIDINKWAGKYSYLKVLSYSLFKRVIQDLCGKDVVATKQQQTSRSN